MDRTAVRFVPMKKQEETFCLNLSVDERLRVLEELNRIGRLAAGYHESRLNRLAVCRR